MSQQGGTVGASDVEAHVGRVATVEAVAVDATLELGVFDERAFIERREVAFVDAHLAPHLVAGFDEAVAEAVVDAVGADVEDERTIGVPAVIVFGRDGDGERVATGVGEQCVPVVKVEIDGIVTLAVQRVALAVGNDSINQQGFVVGHAEIERCDIDGYGDTEVVGVYVGQRGLLLRILNSRRTRGQQPTANSQ